MKVFVQDPAAHINEHDFTLHCPVYPERIAIRDSAHLREINWEVYFLSEGDAVQRFDVDPIAYCGILTDPVTHQKFRPGDNSPKETKDGRLFYFWSDSTRSVFAMMPEMYVAPNYEMNHP